MDKIIIEIGIILITIVVVCECSTYLLYLLNNGFKITKKIFLSDEDMNNAFISPSNNFIIINTPGIFYIGKLLFPIFNCYYIKENDGTFHLINRFNSEYKKIKKTFRNEKNNI